MTRPPHETRLGWVPVLAFGPSGLEGLFTDRVFAVGGRLISEPEPTPAVPSIVRPRVSEPRPQPKGRGGYLRGVGIAVAIAALVVLGNVIIRGANFDNWSWTDYAAGVATPCILSTAFVLFLAELNSPK